MVGSEVDEQFVAEFGVFRGCGAVGVEFGDQPVRGFLQGLGREGGGDAGEDLFGGGERVGVDAVDAFEVLDAAADHPDVVLPDQAVGHRGAGGGQQRRERFAGQGGAGGEQFGVGDEPAGFAGVEVPEVLDQAADRPVAGGGGGVTGVELGDGFEESEPTRRAATMSSRAASSTAATPSSTPVPSMGQW